MTNDELPSVDLLRKIIRLDPETGFLYWLERPVDMFQPAHRMTKEHVANWWNSRHAGNRALAFTNRKGYLVGKINGRYAASHRVVWALAHGEWPDDQVDHINGNKSDNRPENLRVVNNSGNQRNSRLLARNWTGFPGIALAKSGRWQAHIKEDGRQITLGTFDTKAEAIAARKAAQVLCGYDPNHGTPPQ